MTAVFVLFFTSNVNAVCSSVERTQCNDLNPISVSIRSHQPAYQNSESPMITITGTPDSFAYLQVYNESKNMVFSHDLELPPSGVTNYTLNISSYSPGLYLVVVNDSTAKAALYFRVTKVQVLGGFIALKTINSTYYAGDSVAIFGTDRPDGTINLSLLDPNGDTVSSVQANSDEVGQFSSNILKIPSDAVSGWWLINATDGNRYGSQEFKVISSNNTLSPVWSPLLQFKSGIEARDIVCKAGLQLMIKAEDGSPACVTSTGAQMLIARGWGHLP